MATINRTLMNLYKNNQMARVLDAIEKRDGLFDSTSLIAQSGISQFLNSFQMLLISSSSLGTPNAPFS